MRILITGGAGCLGSNLAERYLQDNHEVLVIDNFATGHRSSLPDTYPGLEVVEGSISNIDLVEKLFLKFKPTHVIHSAASYKDPDNWEADTETNIIGTINVIRAAEKIDIVRILYFQTALCYGRPDSIPIPIDADIRPFTSYGISKTCGEQYLLISDLPVVSLRLANVTGPRLSIGPIPTFYKRLKAAQSCYCSETIRDFIDMDDFFSIVDKALDNHSPLGAFNVSTGEGHTIRDVFDLIIEYLGIELTEEVPVLPPNNDDVPAIVLDPADTIEKFNWHPNFSFSDTIIKTLKWYDKYGVDTIYSHLKTADVKSK